MPAGSHINGLCTSELTSKILWKFRNEQQELISHSHFYYSASDNSYVALHPLLCPQIVQDMKQFTRLCFSCTCQNGAFKHKKISNYFNSLSTIWVNFLPDFTLCVYWDFQFLLFFVDLVYFYVIMFSNLNQIAAVENLTLIKKIAYFNHQFIDSICYLDWTIMVFAISSFNWFTRTH